MARLKFGMGMEKNHKKQYMHMVKKKV